MTDLFLDILNVSFSATWVVLGVVLARLVLKKAPRNLVCGLWALVALRLLFGGIEAPFSLIPSSEIIPPESLYDQAPVIHSGVSSIDEAVNPVYSESLRPMPGASVNPLQVWLAVFANLWFLGMIAMALWAAISWFRVWRQVRESIPADDGVYLCDRIGSPFIFGLFRPRIFLPSDMSGESRCHVVAHERAHLARRDHWWKPLGFALLTVNWFNPAMWLAYVLLCRDIEMACDEKVVRNFGVEEKKAYSAALLNCSVNPRRITACPLAFGEVGVKQRIKSVLHYKKPAFWIILAAAVLTAVLAMGLLTDPVDRISEIRYNGNLYVLTDRDYSFLPVEDPVGILGSILHRTTEHPSEELQATNLDKSLTGSPLYLEEEQLFLVKSDGSCMAFKLRTIWDLTHQINANSMTAGILLRSDPALNHEFSYAETNALAAALRALSPEDLTPANDPEKATYSIIVEWEENLFHIRLCGNQMYLIYMGPDTEAYGNTTWKIESNAIRSFFTDFRKTVEETNHLGIYLTAENITPIGATLVCVQDGTVWDQIITGAPFNLERYEDGSWIGIMSENAVWTTVAYPVNQGQTTSWRLNWSTLAGSIGPGRYRLSKTFTGIRMAKPNQEKSELTQTLYAEFVINATDPSLQAKDGFSQELHQATQEDWLSFQALSKEEQLASSKMPGSCSREFDDWAEVEKFVGISIPNPLEGLETLEKGCWAGTPVGYNGASRFYVTWYGTQDGHVQWLQIDSGYRRGDVRVCVNAALYSDPPGGSDLEAASSIGQRRLLYLSQCPNGETVITEDSGEEYEACTGTLARSSVLYSIRVIGQRGTADALLELLNELLPYFEALPTT